MEISCRCLTCETQQSGIPSFILFLDRGIYLRTEWKKQMKSNKRRVLQYQLGLRDFHFPTSHLHTQAHVHTCTLAHWGGGVSQGNHKQYMVYQSEDDPTIHYPPVSLSRGKPKQEPISWNGILDIAANTPRSVECVWSVCVCVCVCVECVCACMW